MVSTSFSEKQFEKNIKKYSNVLIGPGITSKGERFVKIALDNLDTLDSLLVDAGGLAYIDRNRKYSPLVIPNDAVIINNNGTFSNTIQQIKEQIKVFIVR